MCLAMPARIVEKDGDEAWVEMGDSRLRASLVLVPEAAAGDFVLVHAGFAIQTLSEEDARAAFELFREMGAAE